MGEERESSYTKIFLELKRFKCYWQSQKPKFL